MYCLSCVPNPIWRGRTEPNSIGNCTVTSFTDRRWCRGPHPLAPGSRGAVDCLAKLPSTDARRNFDHQQSARRRVRPMTTEQSAAGGEGTPPTARDARVPCMAERHGVEGGRGTARGTSSSDSARCRCLHRSRSGTRPRMATRSFDLVGGLGRSAACLWPTSRAPLRSSLWLVRDFLVCRQAALSCIGDVVVEAESLAAAGALKLAAQELMRNGRDRSTEGQTTSRASPPAGIVDPFARLAPDARWLRLLYLNRRGSLIES